jgi:hypothetical protein
MSPFAWALLEQESFALLARLASLRPFSLLTPMVPAASLSPRALSAIEEHLRVGRIRLRRQIERFLNRLRARHGALESAHRMFTSLKLRFNALIARFYVFSDVMTQRSEHGTGVWLAGLDVAAMDALRLSRPYAELPPLVCYFEREPGGAIRRVRTRLPGGGENPVAIVRVPRERMIGSGIASSLVHEVGHQAMVLLGSQRVLTPLLLARAGPDGGELSPWTLWARWLSEILPDVWAVGRVGVASTLGLMGLVSLPSRMVMGLSPTDPHPIPWIRVKLSCAVGRKLYPHPQWDRLEQAWEQYYPMTRAGEAVQALLQQLEATLEPFTQLVLHHRPPALEGQTLFAALQPSRLQPATLSKRLEAWQNGTEDVYRASPCLVFAVLAQARLDGRLTPARESKILEHLLTHWALESTWNTSAVCAEGLQTRIINRAPALLEAGAETEEI